MKKITLFILFYIACVCDGYGLHNYNNSGAILQEDNCPPPTAIMLSSYDSTSATFVWSTGEGGWQVLVLPVSDPAPTADTQGTAVENEPLYSVSNLTANTAYVFYVRAYCGSELSEWTAFNFTSGCNPTEEINEDLDSTAQLQLPACWRQLLIGASEYAYAAVTNLYAHSGSNAIEINNFNSPNDAKVMLVGPKLSNLPDGTHRLRFFARGGSTMIPLEVGTIDMPTFSGVFNMVQTINLTDTFSEFIVDFATYSGPDTYLVFRHPNALPYSTIHIDDIVWEIVPPCADISALLATNVTPTSATVTWEPGDWEDQWDVVYGSALITDPNLLTPIAPQPEGTPEIVLTGLSEGTAYNVWVRSDCNVDGIGAWVGPLTFTTPCMPSAAFYENFEGSALGSVPDCWSAIIDGPDVSGCYAMVVGSSSVSGTNSMEIFNMFAGDTSHLILVSPNLGGSLSAATHRIRFQARVNTIFLPIIEVGTLNSSQGSPNFTPFQTITLTDTYAEYTVDFSTYEGTDTFIGIRNIAGMFSSIYIDDVIWEEVPLCGNVSGITVAALTTDSALFTWTAAGTETQWDVVYATSNVTDPNSLTPINPAPGNPSVTITGLEAATFYNIWIRSVCGGSEGNGAWIGPMTFSTACFAIDAFSENFDSSTAGSLPACWTGIVSGATVSQFALAEIVSQNSYSGANSVILSNDMSMPTDNIILVSPLLNNISAGTHRLKFYAFRYAFVQDATLTIGTMDGNTASATFTPIQDVIINGAYAEYTVNFTSFTGPGMHIAIRNASPHPHTAIFLDDIRWELAPLCPDVLDIQLTEITPDSALVSWTSGGEGNGWQLAYGTTSVTDPETLTPGDLITEPNQVLNGLSDNTSYHVWVRSVCTATGNGNWIGPVVLKTKCLPMSVPYILDFENAVTPALPECTSSVILNNSSIWRTQTVNQNGFNSKVLRYVRAANNAADAWFFTQGISLTAGTEYVIGYTYGGTNTMYVDKMKITIGSSAEVAAMADVLDDHTFSLNTSVEATTLFTPTTSGTYYLGFHLYSIAGQGIVHVDNIFVDSNLAINDVNNDTVSFYPNPVKDILNLRHNEVITHLALFNMMGQLILESTPLQSATELDVSGISAGNYVLKVTLGNAIKTLKVVKQ